MERVTGWHVQCVTGWHVECVTAFGIMSVCLCPTCVCMASSVCMASCVCMACMVGAKMVHWNADGFKMGLCDVAGADQSKSLLCLSNKSPTLAPPHSLSCLHI